MIRNFSVLFPVILCTYHMISGQTILDYKPFRPPYYSTFDQFEPHLIASGKPWPRDVEGYATFSQTTKSSFNDNGNVKEKTESIHMSSSSNGPTKISSISSSSSNTGPIEKPDVADVSSAPIPILADKSSVPISTLVDESSAPISTLVDDSVPASIADKAPPIVDHVIVDKPPIQEEVIPIKEDQVVDVKELNKPQKEVVVVPARMTVHSSKHKPKVPHSNEISAEESSSEEDSNHHFSSTIPSHSVPYPQIVQYPFSGHNDPKGGSIFEQYFGHYKPISDYSPLFKFPDYFYNPFEKSQEPKHSNEEHKPSSFNYDPYYDYVPYYVPNWNSKYFS